MTVSLCVIAYNEEKALSGLLGDILSQSFDRKSTELVFVDSASSDDTKKIFLDFAEKHRADYLGISVLDNPRKMQAAGWNTAIRAAKGDIIIRIDAHASIPADFIEKNAALIASGENVCGGARPNNIDEPTPFREMLLAAEGSMFGSSIASYRRQSAGKRYVDSLFHGAYRREVFAKVGGFDTSLGRTEDNELHWRIRQNGYRICQSDEIISYQNVRPTLGAMISQKYGNGKWIGLTLGKCPDCLSLFHFVPFCFVMAVLICVAAWIASLFTGIWLLSLPLWLLCGAYGAADLLMTFGAVFTAERKNAYMLLLPMVFPLLHFSYGIGTTVGFIMLPSWKKSLDGSAEKEIEEVRRAVSENTIRK